MTESQREALQRLKADGELETMVGWTEAASELYIYHDGGERITAVHVSGIVTEHYHKRA